MDAAPLTPSMAALVKEIIKVAHDLQIISYLQIASSAILVYDYLLTIGQEIQYIWPTPWSIVKVLFLLQRYLPFADTTIYVLVMTFSSNPSNHMCRTYFLSSVWMYTIGVALSEIVLTTRAWAVWNRNKFLSGFLPVFFIACWVPAAYFQYLVYKNTTFGEAPYATRGCFATGGSSKDVYICWTLLTVYEGALLLLMSVSGMKVYRSGGNTALVTTIHRDGILYYIYLFVLSIINILVTVVLPEDFAGSLTSLERVMYSVLTTRAVLHIHTEARKIQIPQNMSFPAPSGFTDSSFQTYSVKPY